MLSGMKESYKKVGRESILAPSLAVGIVRCQLKRRQGYRWAGLWSFETRLAGCDHLAEYILKEELLSAAGAMAIAASRASRDSPANTRSRTAAIAPGAAFSVG